MLHLLNTVLVFLLLQYSTGTFAEKRMVAALFAVHPMHVETVAWVADRKDLLAMFFLLSAMLAYVGHQKDRSRHLLLLTGGFFLLGLLSKPIVIVLPFLLILFDVWPLQRFAGPSRYRNERYGFVRIIKEKTGLLVLAAVSAAITLLAIQYWVPVASADLLPGKYEVLRAASAYGHYLYKLVWPADLTVQYPVFDMAAGGFRALVLLIVLFLVSVVAVLQRERFPLVFYRMVLVRDRAVSRLRDCPYRPVAGGGPVFLPCLHGTVCHPCVGGGSGEGKIRTGPMESHGCRECPAGPVRGHGPISRQLSGETTRPFIAICSRWTRTTSWRTTISEKFTSKRGGSTKPPVTGRSCSRSSPGTCGVCTIWAT
jgi:hypothetical protein